MEFEPTRRSGSIRCCRYSGPTGACLFALPVAVAVAIGLSGVVAARGESGQAHLRRSNTSNLAKQHLLPCTKEGDDVNFPVFSVGSEFEGLQREGILRYCAKPRQERAELPLRTNYVNLIYGSCRSRNDGCAPPLEIISQPACEGAIPNLPHRNIAVRGVPGAVYPERGLEHLALFTGNTIVVIFSTNGGQAMRAAKALMQTTTNPWRQPDQVPGEEQNGPLAPPAEGALDGTLRCGEAPAIGPSFAPRLSSAHGRQHPLVTLELYSPLPIVKASFDLPATLRITPQGMKPGGHYGSVDFLTETSALRSRLVLRDFKRNEKTITLKLSDVGKGYTAAEAILNPTEGNVTATKIPEGTTLVSMELDGSVRNFITGPGRCKLRKRRELDFAVRAVRADGSVFRRQRATGDLCPSRF